MAQLHGPFTKNGRIAAAGARRPLLDQCGADFEGNADIVLVLASLKFGTPRLEVIHPRQDHALAAARLRRRKFRRPYIVALRLHVDFEIRVGGPGEFPAQYHAQLVVTVREAVGLDGDTVPGNTFGGKSAAIDRRQNRVDDGAHPPVASHGLPSAEPGSPGAAAGAST